MPKIQFQRELRIGGRLFHKDEKVDKETLSTYVIDLLLRHNKIRITSENPNSLEGFY